MHKLELAAVYPPPPWNEHSIHMCCEFICKLTVIEFGCVIFIRHYIFGLYVYNWNKIGKYKSRSASHDKVTMYRLSYVN